MTVRTIEEIGKLLRETASITKCDYKNYRKQLEEKYETKRVRTTANKEEQELYDELRDNMRKWESVLADFEGHKF